ncbi:tRNA 2-selenouridine(34) synthase MnmH [Aquabacterium sp. A08]|uniref:tRNA 2-selenouridine(34) synthase MnmH n=1 Tax=Aquabacterium sp. A08 TaxID=2718532 RepID=UPI00141ED67E|nr:tRNA 2-selenouridine(34) synthase MnmH [Aquabacterium sp. A08]NIC40327.1 tRNA 2-selenouridine(34) synthase MnmH [Aquabacterium sp. A08]
MPLHTLPAADVPARLGDFDTVIDARTEDEYALDHLPGAVNWPTLNNEERIVIGTMYKQVNAFEAKKRGAALSARNIAAHIEREVIDKPKGWKPLVYCWRGGNRSGALATILSAIGFQVTLIEGGYKAWRGALLESLPGLAQRLRYRVVCGPTGSGKTRLLHALADAGAQVLDLEALACHRSSVLGLVPGQPQPSQKHFDSLVWARLRGFDPDRVVYVESESKKVGNLRVPDALMDAMRASPCLDLQLPDEERVALLLEDYAFFLQDPDFFCRRLDALTQLQGRAVIEDWQAQVRAGQSPAVVRELLTRHYDPVYAASIRRNFVQFGAATVCTLPDRSTAALQALARELVAQDTAVSA